MSALSPWDNNEYCPKCFNNLGYHIINESFCISINCLWEGKRIDVLTYKKLRKLKIKKIDDKI